jgi:hypothetical protein
VERTPRTELALTRFKRLGAKLKKETPKAVRDIVVNAASDAVKKTLLGL